MQTREKERGGRRSRKGGGVEGAVVMAREELRAGKPSEFRRTAVTGAPCRVVL